MNEITTAEMVKALRYCAKADYCMEDDGKCPYAHQGDCSGEMMADAADRLERLEAELAAAKEDIPHRCYTCAHRPEDASSENAYICACGCFVKPLTIDHAQWCDWAWRGEGGREDG